MMKRNMRKSKNPVGSHTVTESDMGMLVILLSKGVSRTVAENKILKKNYSRIIHEPTKLRYKNDMRTILRQAHETLTDL